MRKLGFCFIILALGLVMATPGLAQDPSATPDPQVILNRAEEVVTLTEVTAQQNARTIELVKNLAWFFGIIIGIAAAALGLYGFNTQRGFQESMKEYRAQLNQLQIAYQTSLDQNRSDQRNIQELQAAMTAKVQEIEEIEKELSKIKESVTEEFTAAKQAMVLLEIANQFFEGGKRDEAIHVYRNARNLQPGDSTINYRLGRAYSNAGRYEEAIQALEKAVDAKPGYAEAHMELGLTYRRHAEQVGTAEERLAEYRLAERYLLRAVDLNPAHVDALGALGGLCRRAERYSDALDFYRRMSEIDPRSSYAWNNVASLSWYRGDVEEARRAFQCVEKIATERIESGMREGFWDYYDRGLAQLVLGRRDEALADHRTAINNTPEEENFRSVLDNLRFLSRAAERIEGLDEFITMIEEKLP